MPAVYGKTVNIINDFKYFCIILLYGLCVVVCSGFAYVLDFLFDLKAGLKLVDLSKSIANMDFTREQREEDKRSTGT